MRALKDRLEWAMDRAGLSQADLARACRVKPPSVTNWLNGETRTLKAGPAVRAALALGVQPLWLIDGEGPREVESTGTAAYVAYAAAAPPAAHERDEPWPFRNISATRWHALPNLDRQRIETFIEATLQAWEARDDPKSLGVAGR
jgi:transcriptional regulator with XRE-family HTH domain